MSLTPVYTCKICRRSLTIQGPPLIGEKPEDYQAKVAKMLSEHLGKEHEQQMAGAMLTGNALGGLIICHHFSHNDPDLQKYVQLHAASVRRFTGAFIGRWRITDTMIESMVNGHFAEDDPSRGMVIGWLKSMRDQVDEAPEQPKETT